MSVEEIYEGIARLPLPMQRRLLRRLRRLPEKPSSEGFKPAPLWRIRRDPIFYTWLARLHQLSLNQRQQLMERLQELIKKSEYAVAFFALPTDWRPPFDVFTLFTRIRIPYEDFVEARREAWRKWLKESEW